MRARGDRKPDATAALYLRIQSEIAARIVSGAWPPGHHIPSEIDLMVEYGCARMTVNKALSRLAAIGLVERRRRAGTVVSRPRGHPAVVQIPDIQAEITRQGRAYRLQLLSREGREATRADGETLLVPMGTPVLALSCLHLADDQPFALEDRLLNLAAVPEGGGVDFSREPPGTWLLSHVPWTDAEHRITAIGAAGFAALLDLPADAACLQLERHTWRAGASITYVRHIVRGDVLSLSAGFTTSGSDMPASRMTGWAPSRAGSA